MDFNKYVSCFVPLQYLPKRRQDLNRIRMTRATGDAGGFSYVKIHVFLFIFLVIMRMEQMFVV